MPSLSLKCFETILLKDMLMIFSFCITQQKLHSRWNLEHHVRQEFRLERQLLARMDYKHL